MLMKRRITDVQTMMLSGANLQDKNEKKQKKQLKNLKTVEKFGKRDLMSGQFRVSLDLNHYYANGIEGQKDSFEGEN